MKFDLEESSYLRQRSDLLKNFSIPRLSEAESLLGKPLANVVFDQCDEALKDDFGLNSLKGPCEDLWLSPSDMLIGKVRLKPPFTRSHIQALTHEGILCIGEQIKKKFLTSLELEKEEALADQKKELLESFQYSIKAEIKEIEARERAACQKEIERINEEFEHKLIEELKSLESRLRNGYTNSSESQEISLKRKWKNKLENEVKMTVKTMTEKFLEESSRQEEILLNHFKIEQNKSEIRKQYELSRQQQEHKESIKQLKHNLECQNIANMMYILCMERRKCCDEKKSIEKFYKTKINELHCLVDRRDEQIKELNNKINNQVREVSLRETCILEIIKQFQKFINFALRSAPTQAEFLLSIEKMMVFELTDALLKSNFNDLVPCDETLAWTTPQTFSKSAEITPIEIQDYHDCLNELPIPKVEGADEFLPAFYFKNKLYVREDFRNMLSNGIEISPSNDLWSKDVEILMNTLKESVSSIQPSKSEATASPISRSSRKLVKTTSRRSSNIQFDLGHTTNKSKRVSLPQETRGSRRKSSEKDRISLKPTLDSLPFIDFQKIGKEETKQTLLGTRSSLELIMEKGSVRYIGKKTYDKCSDSSSHDEISETRESMDSATQFDISKVKKEYENGVSEGSLRIISKKESDPAGISVANVGGFGPQNEKNFDSIALEARDSIILRQVSLFKNVTNFSVTPKDSVDIKKESLCNLKSKSSRIVSAKDSLELLRESRMVLKEPTQSCVRKESQKSRSATSWTSSKETCYEKCSKQKGSVEVVNGIIPKRIKKNHSDQDRSIKVSHIEVINIEDDAEQTKSVVAFNTTPVIYETGNDLHSKLYKSQQIKPSEQKKPIKDKFLEQPRKIAVVGDSAAKEYMQGSDEFTAERIHSFIALIRDHPNLIKTFTACRR